MLALGVLLSGPVGGQGMAGGPTAGLAPGASDGQGPTRRVLFLYGEPRLTPAVVAVDARIRSVLESRSPVPVAFYTEYLDLNLFDGGVPQPELRELLRRKYATRPLDLIVAAGSRPLRIALHNRSALFSGAPVVFVAVDPRAAADLRFDADVTGTWLRMGWAETLDLARRFQPDTRQAIVIGGSSATDRVWLDQARQQLAAEPGSIQTRYLTDRAFEDVLTEVAALPARTVILAGPFLRDATGRDLVAPEAIARIAAAASGPVYALTDTTLGTGVVGGHVVSFEAHGQAAAELALRVLAGERPAPTDVGTTVPMVDARQLDRWGLDARRLPAGSVVLFREPSVWEQRRWYVLSAAAALLLQSGLIAGLLVQRAKRRRAQKGLAERLRFETLLSDLSSRFMAGSVRDVEQSIQSGLHLVGDGLGVDWATVRVLEDHGDEARLAQAWTRDGVGPRPAVIREDQTPWIFARLREGRPVRVGRPGDLPDEAAVDRQSFEALGVRSAAVLPLVVGRTVVGSFSVGTVGEGRAWPDELVSRLQLLADTFASALERRQAEGAARVSAAQIRDLAGRLMTAQEEERRRIARDLHDDVNQELAALSIALSALGGRLRPGTVPDVLDELARLQARTVTLSEAIRHLSHELHPGVLEHVGLVSALRGYCRDFEREHDVAVTLRADGDLGTVPAPIALCLYRVAQEGLGNVAKHAKAREVRVTLERAGVDVVLAIADDGCGFDPVEARSRPGLGLLSLDERARLVGGRLTVDARPQRGTELRIVVPLVKDGDAPRDRAAG
jgi:signal transduction histidine kinase